MDEYCRKSRLGIFILMNDLATRSDAPVTGMAPLAQARWQGSPAGRRQNDAPPCGTGRACSAPSSLPPVPPAARARSALLHGEFTASVLLPAVRAIAAASGLGTATVFLTVFVMALGEVTGINPVVVRPIVGNRFRPGLGGVVCTVAQAGGSVLDVADVPFDEALRGAGAASRDQRLQVRLLRPRGPCLTPRTASPWSAARSSTPAVSSTTATGCSGGS